MSSLTETEKRYFERLFGMKTGFVLKYSDSTFGALFFHYNVYIHDQKYQTFGTSKANKLRAFWTKEPDALVGKVLNELLEAYEAECHLGERDMDKPVLEKSREIVRRLLAQTGTAKTPLPDDDFLRKEFSIPNIQKLPIEATMVPIIEGRLQEVRVVMKAGAHLSTIFLCGSVLEAVLLGAAQRQPDVFNRARSSPKASNGSTKRFQEWNLAQFIDVACEVGILKPDVKKFSHGLRDFRNYIHPYEQMISGFMPDQHTAKVCFQVLKAALASVAGERK